MMQLNSESIHARNSILGVFGASLGFIWYYEGIRKIGPSRAGVFITSDYIADDSEARADAFIETIDQKFHALAGRSNMGRLRDELAEGLRSFRLAGIASFIPLFRKASRLSACCTAHETWAPFSTGRLNP